MPEARRAPRPAKVDAIADYRRDVEAALRTYYAPEAPAVPRKFLGYTAPEMAAELSDRLNELDLTSSFMILTALEATFRIDFLERCGRRLKDPVSRDFRELRNRKGNRVSLEDDILKVWRDRSTASPRVISELRAALRYRHWIAHGRYWQPKLGRTYDFATLYRLAATTLGTFPLVTMAR